MDQNPVAKASVTIDAPQANVWHALANPDTITQYMQDQNPTGAAGEHSEKNWRTMLDALKALLETQARDQ